MRREVLAEAIGTALLLAAVVGSGIMAERLCGGNVGLELLANAIATGGALYALIVLFGPISGAHFNPVVTLSEAWLGRTPWPHVAPYLAAQFAGAMLGVAAAHGMFELPIYFASQHVRSGPAQWWGEFIATFGLLIAILFSVRHRPAAVPYVVGAYISAAYWFTSSTSFANPAVTLARSLTDTFAGIRPVDVPWFMAAQFAGGAAAVLAFTWMAQD